MSKLYSCLLFLAVAVGGGWAQPVATTTALGLSATSVQWHAAVTLIATVKAGAQAVKPGLVRFCNANAITCTGPGLLGQAQLTANGTASLNLALALGPHSIKAEFAGTKAAATSSSTVETVTVTGLRPSSSSLNTTVNSPYTLMATVSGYGSQAPTGNLSVTDTSNGNYALGSVALGAATTTQAFTPQIGTGAGSEPTSLADGDFDGDGYPDLVLGDVNAAAGGGASTAVIYLSAGNSKFSAPVMLNLPSSVSGVSALAVGDFNNDGKLDLIIASGNTNSVTVMLGDGKGNLNYQTALPTGTDPNSIAVADFNGDGNTDLAITNQFSSSVTILLGNGMGGFAQASLSPPTDSFPYSIATGDFNGDGIPDLAVANYFGFDVTVLLGHGDGTFSAAASPVTGVYPDSIAVADFNGDGKPDLAVANQFSRTVTILLGDGKGNFSPEAQAPATGNNPDSVVVADFNGDGIEDLAVANSNDNTVLVFRGKGDGTFPSSTVQTVQLPAGTAPYAVTALDLNADGMEDLAVAGSGNNTVAIAPNTVTSSVNATLTGVKVVGGGTHNILATYPGNGTYAASAASVFVAGTPIATTTVFSVEPAGTVGAGETVQLTATVTPALVAGLTATGTVTFYSGTTSLATVPIASGLAVYNYTATTGTRSVFAKYNGDANFLSSASAAASVTAIAKVASNITLSVSSGSATKGTPLTLTAAVTSGNSPVKQGAVIFCNAAMQFCEDSALLGNAQLTANGTASIRYALPVGVNSVRAIFSGAAQFLTSVSAAKTVTVSASANLATTTSLALSGTPGNYALTGTVAGGSWPAPTGKLSFVDTSNKNLLLGSNALVPGAPVFAQSAALTTGNNPESIAVADFNGDGKPDLAVANTNASSVSIFLGNGGGAFTAEASPISGTPNFNYPFRLVSGDFNSDGKSDLAVANTNGSVTILLGNGDGTFVVKSVPTVPGSPFALAVGDFNGDGGQDLAVSNRNTSAVTILLGNGDGTFTPDPVSPPSGASVFAIVTADFNHDGKADLAMTNEFDGDLTILLGNGDGTFTPTPSSPVTGASPLAMTVADFNQDGAPDLAVVNFGDSTVSILLGNGDGTFTQGGVIATGFGPQGIVAGDFNGDGSTDLAVTDSNASTLTLLLGYGFHGQFESRTVPLAAGSGPVPIVAGDFNQDGGPDLAFADVNSNALRILLNSATSYASVSGIAVPGSGTHQIEAIYGGTAPYLGSTSATVAATATPVATSVIVSFPIATAGQSVPITVSISPVSMTNLTPTGTVSLYNGSALLATATITNGRATFNETFAAAGTVYITTKYSGDTNFAPSASAVTPLHVVAASTHP